MRHDDFLHVSVVNVDQSLELQQCNIKVESSPVEKRMVDDFDNFVNLAAFIALRRSRSNREIPRAEPKRACEGSKVISSRLENVSETYNEQQ